MQPAEAKSAQSGPLADAQYTCPKSPKIIRRRARCPADLRHALEPMVPSDESPARQALNRLYPYPPYVDLGCQAVPLIVPDHGGVVDCRCATWIGFIRMASYLEFVLPRPFVLWAALRSFSAVGDFGREPPRPNMWTSSVLGVGAANLYSIFATFLPASFRNNIAMGHGVPAHIRSGGGDIATGYCRPVLELRR